MDKTMERFAVQIFSETDGRLIGTEVIEAETWREAYDLAREAHRYDTVSVHSMEVWKAAKGGING